MAALRALLVLAVAGCGPHAQPSPAAPLGNAPVPSVPVSGLLVYLGADLDSRVLY
jgi:hypothetical protein